MADLIAKQVRDVERAFRNDHPHFRGAFIVGDRDELEAAPGNPGSSRNALVVAWGPEDGGIYTLNGQYPVLRSGSTASGGPSVELTRGGLEIDASTDTHDVVLAFGRHVLEVAELTQNFQYPAADDASAQPDQA